MPFGAGESVPLGLNRRGRCCAKLALNNGPGDMSKGMWAILSYFDILISSRSISGSSLVSQRCQGGLAFTSSWTRRHFAHEFFADCSDS